MPLKPCCVLLWGGDLRRERGALAGNEAADVVCDLSVVRDQATSVPSGSFLEAESLAHTVLSLVPGPCVLTPRTQLSFPHPAPCPLFQLESPSPPAPRPATPASSLPPVQPPFHPYKCLAVRQPSANSCQSPHWLLASSLAFPVWPPHGGQRIALKCKSASSLLKSFQCLLLHQDQEQSLKAGAADLASFLPPQLCSSQESGGGGQGYCPGWPSGHCGAPPGRQWWRGGNTVFGGLGSGMLPWGQRSSQ